MALQSFNNMLSEVGEKIGTKAHPHKLRHTFGYRHYGKNHDLVGLMQLLGHSSIETTREYSHVDPEEEAGFIEDLHQDLGIIFKSSIEGYGD